MIERGFFLHLLQIHDDIIWIEELLYNKELLKG